MVIITVGIDLAKNVFWVPGVGESVNVALQRTVRGDRLLDSLATLATFVIAMETCSDSSHSRLHPFDARWRR